MVAGVRAGEGQWGMEEMQGVDNRGPVMGKLETAGGSHWKGRAPVPGGWFTFGGRVVLSFPMSVSNPCSVMIGRVLSKDLGEEEGDGVSVHWYTPKEGRTHVGGQSTEEALVGQILSMTATTKESLTPE